MAKFDNTEWQRQRRARAKSLGYCSRCCVKPVGECKCLEKRAAYRTVNKKSILKYASDYAKSHKAERARRQLEYYYRHRSGVLEKMKAYHQAHPELGRAKWHSWRARMVGAEGEFTAKEWAALIAKQNGRCAYCGAECDLTVDHIEPIGPGVLNTIENIQGLCLSCNIKKSDKVNYVPPPTLGLYG